MVFKKISSRNKVSYPAKKAMTAIAKSVLNKETETKSMLKKSLNIQHFPDTVYALNLNAPLLQGISSEQVIGEKIHLKNIHLKLLITAINSTGASNQNLIFRTLVVRTKKALTVTQSSVAFDDIFRGGTESPTFDRASLAMVDLHRVDLLYDKTHVFSQPNQANVDVEKPVDIQIKINKNHMIDTDNGSYFKDKNYYLITTCHKNDLTAVNVGLLNVAWTLNFKNA